MDLPNEYLFSFSYKPHPNAPGSHLFPPLIYASFGMFAAVTCNIPTASKQADKRQGKEGKEMDNDGRIHTPLPKRH